MSQTLATKVGSRARWRFAIEEDDAPVDLTGYTATLRMRGEDGSLKITDAALTLDDQVTNTGEVYYDPAAGDVDTAGEYRIELWTTAGGIPDRWPRKGSIRVTIDPTL